MKKPFCDICGAPAMEGKRWRELTVPVGQPWRGYRTEKNGSGCESNWQPEAVACVGFGITKFKDVPDSSEPDICAKCAREITQKLLDQIPTPDRISVAVEQEL